MAKPLNPVRNTLEDYPQSSDNARFEGSLLGF